jgi:hypothetical protein
VAAAQHASPAAQHASLGAQQSAAFTRTFAAWQQASPETQHDSPAAQQSTVAAAVLLSVKQHSCGGLQQAAPGTQQLTFEAEKASLQAVLPPITPRSTVRGASNFKDILSLQFFNRSGNGRRTQR